MHYDKTDKKKKRKSRPQDKRSNRLAKQGGNRAIYRTEKSHKKETL